MRIGKKPSSRSTRHLAKAGANGKPKHISSEVVIGQLSSDLVATVYAPMIQEIAGATLERYAEDLMQYEDAVQELRRQRDLEETNEALGEDGEVEVDTEGFVSTESDHELGLDDINPPQKPRFHSQYAVDEMSSYVFDETSNHFFSKEGGWKTQANNAKFERMMDEKYGVFRPFLKEHPQVEEAIRSLQRKYATGFFSPFRQKDPPIPKSTAVILLFMMQRGKTRWEIMLLTALFLLVGLQPWALVSIVGLVQILLSRRKRAAVGTMKTHISAVESYYEGAETAEEKHKILEKMVGTPISDDLGNQEYDTIIVGSGPSALYTGALLARAGRKILVLSSNSDASGCVTMEESNSKLLPQKYKDVPFDIQNSNIPKLSSQAGLLAPALSTQTDLQGGLRFAKVGSDADNHAFEVLEIPGLGPGGSSYTTVLTAGSIKESLMDEAATFLGDGWPGSDGSVGNSAIGAYISACEEINTTSMQFYTSKIIPDSANGLRSKNTYGECAIRYAAGLLNASFPLNAQTRSLVAAIGMRSENIRPKNTSLAAHVTHLCSATSGEGMHYPVGGPRALCHALANIIERNGGKVVTGAPVKELLFDDSPDAIPANTSVLDEGERAPGQEGKEDTKPCPRCVGVMLFDGRPIKFSNVERSSDPNIPAVISMTGLVDTFIRLLPDELRVKHKVPRGLPALSESRPLKKALLLFVGTASELELTGADYYRLPNAAKAIDEIDPQTGEITVGEIGWSSETMEAGESSGEQKEEAIVVDEEDGSATQTSPEERKKRRRGGFKYETGQSWMSVSFPSAKDPSFEDRHGKITTCVITFEADDDFVQSFETKPKLYIPKQSSAQKSNEERLLQRLKRDLFDLYPRLEGKVIHAEILNGLVRSLMHNPERYAAKGVRADTPYPGLYVGGTDLTVSGSFSAGIVGGWLAANAVAGYSYVDLLFLQKTITSDIEQFLEVPETVDEEDADVAVPLSQREAGTEETPSKDKQV